MGRWHEPEHHLVVGEISLSHLVGWYQTLSPAGCCHLQQGCWLTIHTMQERQRVRKRRMRGKMESERIGEELRKKKQTNQHKHVDSGLVCERINIRFFQIKVNPLQSQVKLFIWLIPRWYDIRNRKVHQTIISEKPLPYTDLSEWDKNCHLVLTWS